MKSRFIFITFVMLCMLCNHSFSAPIKKGKDTKEILVNHAKLKIQDMMSDPESVRLKIAAVSIKHKRVCGEFNSKNRMGGYVGFLPFFYSENPLDEGGALVLGQDNDEFGGYKIANLSKLVSLSIKLRCLQINEKIININLDSTSSE